MKKLGIIIGIIVAIVVCLPPLKTVAYTVMVDYEDTETYYEDEAYNATETYTETLSLDYEVIDTEERINGDTATVSVVLRNQDSVAGTFIIDLSIIYGCTFIGPGSIELTSMIASDERELYLEPDDMGTATCSADNPYPSNCGFDSWNYDVIPSIKEIEGEREVTKYRQVEKQRAVIKQRPETHYKKVTLLDYLLHYQ